MVVEGGQEGPPRSHRPLLSLLPALLGQLAAPAHCRHERDGADLPHVQAQELADGRCAQGAGHGDRGVHGTEGCQTEECKTIMECTRMMGYRQRPRPLSTRWSWQRLLSLSSAFVARSHPGKKLLGARRPPRRNQLRVGNMRGKV
eukprot:scaffold133046_cov63-Phaeocystis_antarctica.AAC.2